MKTSHSTSSRPGRGTADLRPALLLALALAAPHAGAATGAVAGSRLPLLLLMVPLLAAFALALRAWFPRLRAGSPVGRSTRDMDWPRLARLSAQFFEAHGLEGFDPQQRWDPARDLVLQRERHGCLVRARLWRARQVDAAAVQQLARDAARVGASRGILLCAHDVFTPAARQLARQQGVLLLDAAHMPTRSTPRAAPAATPASASRLAGLEAPGPRAAVAAAPAAAAAALLRSEGAHRARRSFQPTEPLETQSGELAAAAAPEQPTLVLPRKAPLLADRPLAAARREFQPTEPLQEQAAQARAAAAPAVRTAPGKRSVPSRREFLPTAPMPVSGLAAL